MKNKRETDHKRHVRQYKIVKNINSPEGQGRENWVEEIF